MRTDLLTTLSLYLAARRLCSLWRRILAAERFNTFCMIKKIKNI